MLDMICKAAENGTIKSIGVICASDNQRIDLMRAIYERYKNLVHQDEKTADFGFKSREITINGCRIDFCTIESSSVGKRHDTVVSDHHAFLCNQIRLADAEKKAKALEMEIEVVKTELADMLRRIGGNTATIRFDSAIPVRTSND